MDSFCFGKDFKFFDPFDSVGLGLLLLALDQLELCSAVPPAVRALVALLALVILAIHSVTLSPNKCSLPF